MKLTCPPPKKRKKKKKRPAQLPQQRQGIVASVLRMKKKMDGKAGRTRPVEASPGSHSPRSEVVSFFEKVTTSRVGRLPFGWC